MARELLVHLGSAQRRRSTTHERPAVRHERSRWRLCCGLGPLADLLGLLERGRLRVDSPAAGADRDAPAVAGDGGVGEVGDAVLAHAHRVSERSFSGLGEDCRFGAAAAGGAAENALARLVG